jgi:transcription initiation factor TFIIB
MAFLSSLSFTLDTPEETPVSVHECIVEHEAIVCPNCGSENIRYDNPQVTWTCGDCGYTDTGPNIDCGKDWREFDHDKQTNRNRVGAPTNLRLYDKGLSTQMGGSPHDTRGSRFSALQSQRYRRLKVVDDRSKIATNFQTNFLNAMEELNQMARPDLLDLNENKKQRISLLYRKFYQTGKNWGKNVRTVVAALAYMVCHEDHDTRALNDIVIKTHVRMRDLNEYRKLIATSLGMAVHLPKPQDYLKRILSRLEADEEWLYTATAGLFKQLERYHAIQYQSLVGKEPCGIAAGAIYFICRVAGYPRTQHEIGKIVDVTEVTVRNRYRNICKILHIPLKVMVSRKKVKGARARHAAPEPVSA